MKKSSVLTVILSFALSSLAFDAPVESRYDIRIGGYVKLDAIHQDAHLGVERGALGTVGAPPSAATENRDQTNFTARQSRLNLTITGPEAFGAKTRAFIEGDFFGQAGRNHDGNFRMRHATFTLAWDTTEVMFGQFWDIFGPMAPSTLDFGTGNNIGAPNNPRVAQVRLSQKVNLNEGNSLRFIVGLQDPRQDDLATVTETKSPAGNVAGQIVFESTALGVSPGYWGLPMQPLTISLFGQYGRAQHRQFDTATPPALVFEETVDTWGAGIFAHVPILKSSDGKSRAMTLSFEGQTYIAEGMDWNGATARRTIGTTADTLEAAEGYGAFGQLIFYPTQPTGIVAGYGRRGVLDTSNYRAREVPGTTQRYNDAYFINVSQDFGNVRLAAEYMRLEGKYFDPANDASANRYQFSAIYFF